MALADYITACVPPDGCTMCQFKAQVAAEDVASAKEALAFVARHHAFIRSLKRWAKTQAPDVKAKLMAEISKGEREWPTVPPQRRIIDWKGWNKPSEKS